MSAFRQRSSMVNSKINTLDLPFNLLLPVSFPRLMGWPARPPNRPFLTVHSTMYSQRVMYQLQVRQRHSRYIYVFQVYGTQYRLYVVCIIGVMDWIHYIHTFYFQAYGTHLLYSFGWYCKFMGYSTHYIIELGRLNWYMRNSYNWTFCCIITSSKTPYKLYSQ